MTPASMANDSGSMADRATILAGVPNINMAVYHRIRFVAGDPAAVITLPGRGSTLILRDIEMERARKHVRVDHVHCPSDFPPESGSLSGDRPTATAQAAAEFLRREGVREIWTDRTLPMIFAWHIEQVGVELRYDPDFGVRERRSKDEQEVEFMRASQRATEEAIEMACRVIARASAKSGGVLHYEGEVLTAERVRTMIDVFLLHKGYINPRSIVACGPEGGDCHNDGTGPLRTEQPIIVDVFPRSNSTLYYGDCTRMVVHGPPGNIPEPVRKMHAAVKEAKAACIAATRAGVTGEHVHLESVRVMEKHGYPMGLNKPGDPPSRTAMVHGTGHGLGLDLKEPPLLDMAGPVLVEGDAVTIEPGLYSLTVGGMRLEDLVIVRMDGCENLNTLHEGLTWE
ncbi:MAG TPA: M24 family metallopeptidase [Phycisphaerales bacterium]|nr:M24 family metallopeptidase [Phycisphaerales bacterium]